MTDRAKIGLALSGGSGRAITHVAVIDVLTENNIPIDYISAVSSGAIIAGSFACGTLREFKRDWLAFDKKSFFGLFSLNKNGRGVFGKDKMEEWLNKYFTDRRLEEPNPRLGFVAVDLWSRKPVLLSMGSIIAAVHASCAVPGLFEPREWGNMLLADGGLVRTVPVAEAREMGADIVIGVDILSRKHVFTRRTLLFRRGYNFLKQSRVFAPIRYFSKKLRANQPGSSSIFSILGQAMDIVIDVDKTEKDYQAFCDVVISPNVKHYDKLGLGKSAVMYEEGRRETLKVLPVIKKFIDNFNKHD